MYIFKIFGNFDVPVIKTNWGTQGNAFNNRCFRNKNLVKWWVPSFITKCEKRVQ